MYLTEEEEKMLKGEFGLAVQKAMQILVALGDIYDAERMVPVSNVHMPGSSVVVAGDAGLRFVEEIASTSALFKTYTTLNPAAVDLKGWEAMGIPRNFFEKQLRLTRAYERMGAVSCHTCTPYLIGNLPRNGEHIAWGESSAIAFSNSIIGSRTNREGGPSALASALTGRTPLYGLHLDENRRGRLLIKVDTDLKDVTDYGALGYFVGKVCGGENPVFVNKVRNPSIDQLKMLGAALASSGSVALYHIVGITPEARTEADAFQGEKPSEKVYFGHEELERAKEELSKEPSDQVDIVCIGCPHSSLNEISEVAELLRGRKVDSDVKLWVCTSLSVKSLADRMGYTEVIERAGGVIVCDTCPVLAPTKELVKLYGYRTIATNSAKLAHYAPGQCNLMPHYGDTKACIKAAVDGVWRA